jgi:iron(III) transport system substrate-binding protein
MANWVLALVLILFVSCNNGDGKKEIWIYTSLYKDTIADMSPRLEKAFPHLKINWYQAGSEEIAAKINTELIAGAPKADILLSSERFWYQELSNSGKLVNWKPTEFERFADQYKNQLGTFHVVSVPVMVMVYNSDVVKAEDAPKSFKELVDPKFKGMLNGGSPLASGTAFTTVLALQHKYGWDYFHQLKKNGFLFDGGNSAVIKRIQTKERPIGFVLLENVLRFQNEDKRLKIIYPEDGVVTQFNTMGIPKKDGPIGDTLKVADWFFTEEGQNVMTRSFMHSPFKNFLPPVGAPTLEVLNEKAFPWTDDLIKTLTEKRFDIKETYVEIMFK